MSELLYLDMLYQFDPDHTPEWLELNGTRVWAGHQRAVYHLFRWLYEHRVGGVEVGPSTRSGGNVANVLSFEIGENDTETIVSKVVRFTGETPFHIQGQYTDVFVDGHFTLDVHLPEYMFSTSETDHNLNQLHYPIDSNLMKLTHEQRQSIQLGNHRILFPTDSALKVARHTAYRDCGAYESSQFGKWVFTAWGTEKLGKFQHWGVATESMVKLLDVTKYSDLLVEVNTSAGKMYVPLLSVRAADLSITDQTYWMGEFRTNQILSTKEYVGGRVMAISPATPEGNRMCVYSPSLSVFNDFMMLNEKSHPWAPSKLDETVDHKYIGLGVDGKVGVLTLKSVSQYLARTEQIPQPPQQIMVAPDTYTGTMNYTVQVQGGQQTIDTDCTGMVITIPKPIDRIVIDPKTFMPAAAVTKEYVQATVEHQCIDVPKPLKRVKSSPFDITGDE